MEASTSEVLLKCLNVLELTEDRCPSIHYLADAKIYCRLVSILKNEKIEYQNLASLTPTLEALLHEHFAGANLVVFEEAVGGNCEELTKLTLLLLYIALFTDAKLRGRLVNSSALDQATQARFKYLLEAVQRRGSSISSRFLHILCTEEIGAKSPLWGHSQINGTELRSPSVYTTSPKSSIASPLRELVQSPHFRLQELLNSKKREVRHLQQQVTTLEGDKQEMTHTIASANNKITKLREEVSQLQAKLQASQQQQDEAQAQAMVDDNLKLQQVKELAVKCSQLRKENTSLQQTEDRLKEENDDLTARNSSLRQQLQLVRLDKDRLQEEVSALREAKFENEDLIESQASDIREMKTQLEELRQCLLEHKSASVSIEESFGSSPLHYSSVNSPSSSGEENMAEAVVEKLLKEELRQLQLQHSALQQEFATAAAMRDQLLEQAATYKEHNRCLSEEVRQKTSAVASLTEELSGVHEAMSSVVKEKEQMLQEFENEKVSLSAVIKAQEDSLSALQQEVKDRLEETSHEKSAMMMTITLKEEECKDLQKRLESSEKSSEDDKLKFITSLEEKEECITELKEQMSKLRTRMNEDKAVLDAQIKLIEKAALDEKMMMESTIKLMTEEKEGEILKKENCVAELQNEKDTLLKIHHEEKCLLTSMVEEHKTALETLQQKFDTVTSQHINEKENLESDLRCSQESYSSLVKELEAAQESHKSQFATQQLALQEKMAEILDHKKQMENLKEVHKDSLRKSEGEVQKLLSSLEAEQQCVTELRQEIAALMNTKSKDSDVIDRLKECNEQLNKEIAELKDCAVSFEHSKQVLEGEKVELIISVQEKEKCIMELKEQIGKLISQMHEEKAAVDARYKMIEKESHEEQQKMETMVKSMTEENEKKLYEKQNLITELESEKDNLLKMHHEEKCLLANMVAEHKTALETLQQKFDSVTSQHITEKEKLESYVFDLKKEVENLKEVQEDLLRKSEGEVQELFSSFETEQQCVTELRQEIAALMDTKSKDSDNLDRLRESNEQLNKEIKELKDCAASFTNSKQLLEGEKVGLITSLQEKENCITELKEEIGKLRDQMYEEKAAFDAKFKTIEKDSYEKKQKMESTVKSMTEEKERAIHEKQNLIAELQNEKDNLSAMHHKEKCLLTNMMEEHKTALETLQQKFNSATSQHMTEKEKLESDVLDLTKKMEALKEVQEDLLRKSESEVQGLSASLEAEQQCVTKLRQEIAALMDTKCKDSDCLDKLKECNEQLSKEITELKDCAVRVENSKQMLEEENLKFATILQEKDGCITELKEDIDKLRTQMNEERAAFDAKFKMIEKDSYEKQQKMESTVKSITEEKTKEIQRKENFISELTSEKSCLSKMHHEEKCLLTKMAEEHKAAHETLQQKFDSVTSQHRSEKEKLESDVLDLTKKMETLKNVQEDLLRKSEAEVQRLSTSLQAEQQCVTELRQEIAALMDTKSKDSDCIIRMKESNEEVNKEITVLKDSLAEVTEKYLTLRQESEEAAQHHKSEVSCQKEELTEKEKALSALLTEVKNKKQMFEEEQSTFVANLEEREKCITQLKKEICKVEAQMNKEKSVHDAHMKAVERDSYNEQQRLESTIRSIAEEKAREIQEMEGLVAELQKEKDRVCQMHYEEKCVLTKMVEEHKGAHDTLQERLEKQTNQHKEENEQLKSDLQAAQNALHEAATKDIQVYGESTQELSNEIARLKGCMAEQDERYLMLQKQTEEHVQHHTSEESRYEDQPCRQEEVHQALRSEFEHCKHMFEEEKLSLVNTIREREEMIMQLKEEIKQLTGQMNEKAVIQQQVDSNRQTLEQEQLLMSSSTEETLLGQKQVSSLHKDLQQMKKQLTEATDSLQQHRAAATVLNQKLAASEVESKKHHSRVLALESQIIDKEKALGASKEELMRVERESEKSLHSLTEELQAAKEKAKLERGAADRIRKTYKTEVEKLTLQVAEWEVEKKEKEIVLKKYETAKKKLGETVTQLDEARTTNRHYQQQLSQFKDCIKKLEENLQKEKLKGNEAQNRVLEVEGKYQPLKEKLHESENIIKRLNTEKRSLEMQLHHAEGQIKEQKKIQRRESFWEQEAPASSSHRLTRMSVSDSQVQGCRATRSTTSSSSAEEYWGCNDSTEKLLPKKRSRDQVQRGMRSDTEDSVFLKPETRAKVVGGGSVSGEERGCQPKAPAAPTDTKTHHLAPPPPDVVLDRSLGKSIPRSMHFRCDEEEEELFNNKYLHDMKIGRCNPVGDEQWRRLSELQRRNSLYPPHMRSAYPVEMQFRPLDDFEDDKLREGCAIDDRQLLNLTEATENLELDSPAFNLRKRKSPSDSVISETSLDSSEGKKTRRLSTSYSRPGPPTPGRRLSRGDKENRRESSASELSLSLWQGHRKEGAQGLASRGNSPVTLHPQPDSGRVTRRRQMGRTTSSSSVRSQSSPARSPTVLSKKGMSTPQGRKGMTPSSLRKILAKGKSPWRKFDSSDETPKGLGDSTNSNGSSKLRIFRKPFGSRNYNVLSASLRSQEKPGSLDDSLTTSAGHSSGATTELRPRRRR